jgi:hypothetical protein
MIQRGGPLVAHAPALASSPRRCLFSIVGWHPATRIPELLGPTINASSTSACCQLGTCALALYAFPPHLAPVLSHACLPSPFGTCALACMPSLPIWHLCSRMHAFPPRPFRSFRSTHAFPPDADHAACVCSAFPPVTSVTVLEDNGLRGSIRGRAGSLRRDQGMMMSNARATRAPPQTVPATAVPTTTPSPNWAGSEGGG